MDDAVTGNGKRSEVSDSSNGDESTHVNPSHRRSRETEPRKPEKCEENEERKIEIETSNSITVLAVHVY